MNTRATMTKELWLNAVAAACMLLVVGLLAWIVTAFP